MTQLTSLSKEEDHTCVYCHEFKIDNTKFCESVTGDQYFVCQDDLAKAQLEFEWKLYKRFNLPPNLK